MNGVSDGLICTGRAGLELFGGAVGLGLDRRSHQMCVLCLCTSIQSVNFKPFNLSAAANRVGKPLLLEEFGVEGLGEST